MGGGGKGGGSSCQTVGYSYYLDMAYSFCDKIDNFLGFYLSENKNWSGTISTSGSTFTCWTGVKADLGESYASPSTMTLYLGNQTTDNAYLTSRTGYQVAYSNVCYLVFPQAFIGDNVRNVPTYGVLVNRYNIDSASNLSGYTTYKNIIGTKSVNLVATQEATQVTGLQALLQNLGLSLTITTSEQTGYALLNISGANPAYVLYDILVTLLKIPTGNIDGDSFEEAAEVLFNEKLGINLVIHSSQKGIDWVSEILRYANGVIYYNSRIGKYALKLYRKDYAIEDLMEITEDNSSALEFSRPSRADVPNTFTIKYANISGNETPRKESMVLTNNANLAASKVVKNIDVDFTCVNTDEAISQVVSYYFQKMSYPLATLKCNISVFDAPYYQIGDVFLFSHSILTGDASLVFRIVKMTADNVKDAYVTIDAVEDVFSIGEVIGVPQDTGMIVPISYNLTEPPAKMQIFECTPENSYTKAVHVAAVYSPELNAYVRSLRAYELSGQTISFQPWKYGVVQSITVGDETTLDRELKIYVVDTYGSFYEVTASESDFQRAVYTAYWGQEVISFKTCTEVEIGLFEFSGVIRGLQNKRTTHSVGEDFWIAPMAANTLPKIDITSLTPTISVFAENSYGNSPEISKQHTYQFTVETPYPPNSLNAMNTGEGTADLVWSPCMRLMGANWRNCDTIIAGQDEGYCEGIFNVYKNGTLIDTIIPSNNTNVTFLTYAIDSMGTYEVETQVGTYKSSKVAFVVTGDFLNIPPVSILNADPFADGSGVALYPFDTNANNVLGTMHGTITGGSLVSGGKFGQYCSCPNTSSYVTFAGLGTWFANRSQFTLAFWGKPSNVAQATAPFFMVSNTTHVNPYYQLRIDWGSTAISAQATSNSSPYVTHSIIADSNFHHVVITFNSGILKLYYDGGLLGSVQCLYNSIGGCYANAMLGRIPALSSTSNAASTYVDQMRVFNRALEEDEVSRLYYEE